MLSSRTRAAATVVQVAAATVVQVAAATVTTSGEALALETLVGVLSRRMWGIPSWDVARLASTHHLAVRAKFLSVDDISAIRAAVRRAASAARSSGHEPKGLL